MENPWPKLPAASPYVLEIDREAIDEYNAQAVVATKINVESIPEPFIV